jgi:ribosomal protein L32
MAPSGADRVCPNCGSTRTRRGGNLIWAIYVALTGLALVSVLMFGFNAAIVAGIVITASVIAHLTIGGRVCLDCGYQFK